MQHWIFNFRRHLHGHKGKYSTIFVLPNVGPIGLYLHGISFSYDLQMYSCFIIHVLNFEFINT